MVNSPSATTPATGGLGLNEVSQTFETAVEALDAEIRAKIAAMGSNPASTDAMEFQRLMAQQSIMVQTGTGLSRALKIP